MIGALGVTAEGVKVPLGVVEGSTENATVVRRLITDLRDRGLDACGGTLFILDGGKALRKAVGDVYGQLAVIARCRIHKERNVMDHLPEAQRPRVRRKLRQAYANPNAGEAEAALKALARQLDGVNPDVGASLREGLTETLTMTRLGVTGTLLKTVMSTNPVESMIEIVRANAHNVKRWAAFDRTGRLWFTGQNGLHGVLDPKSGAMEVFDSPRGRGPYGITASRLVRSTSLPWPVVTSASSPLTVGPLLEPPTPEQGARRIWSDSAGSLWVSEWNTGQLSRYVPSNRRLDHVAAAR